MSTTTLLSFADFEGLPDTPGKRELIDGEVIELPPAKFRHTQLAQELYDLLRSGAPGKRTFQEAGYRLGQEGWVQPDVSITWPGHPVEGGYLTGAPMLAIEILSPSNSAGQIDRKVTMYFAEGAAEVWVVNPEKRTLTVYRQTGDDVRRLAIRDRYTSEILGGVVVELAQMFA